MRKSVFMTLGIFLCMFFLTGCTAVRIDTADIDNIVNVVLSKDNSLYNHIGKGYKYYIPRGVIYTDTIEFNDRLYSDGNYYYLYIDAISYYYQKDVIHKNDGNSYYFKELDINGKKWKYHTIYAWIVEKWLYKHKLHFFDSKFKRTIKNLKLVAALNGGDGLTDIYGEKLLSSRLPEMNLAMELDIPFIVMPQTIGPFIEDFQKQRIINILRKAKKIYIRDKNFVEELEKNNLTYIEENDLSYYMQPIPFPIDIPKPCVGINVSGLTYSNRFGNLIG